MQHSHLIMSVGSPIALVPVLPCTYSYVTRLSSTVLGPGELPVRSLVSSESVWNKRSPICSHRLAFPTALLLPPYLDTVMSEFAELSSHGGEQEAVELAHGSAVSGKY